MRIGNLQIGGSRDSWNANKDTDKWSFDFFLHTEGFVSFGEGDIISFSYFLLELHFELKLAIMSNIGNQNFERVVALPYSGSGLILTRNINELKLSHGNSIYENVSWNSFMNDFIRLEREIYFNMNRFFPKFMQTSESRFLFGQVS